ncbi:MAG: hypothetical protein IJX78_04095 [Bacilli bacterium]|nr:hypothetical protein [Bacilli bacterium]
MSKITINVNGEEMEVDFDTLDKETAEKLGINIHKEDDHIVIKKKNKWRGIKNKITGITPFVVLIAFFLTGFLLDAWSWNWTFFLAIPVVSILLNIKFSRPKKAISSILCLVILAAYFLTGFFLHIWSWNWVLFFLMPIVWILFGE